MKIFRKFSVILSALLFALISLLMGLMFFGTIRQTEAIYTGDTSSYVSVDEIYNSDANKFSEKNLSILLQKIAGSSSVGTNNMSTINTMAGAKTSDEQSGTSAATIRTKTYGKTSSQNIVVKFGGLDWQVVYLSKDNSGNSILTLWLSNCVQSAWTLRDSKEGDFYGFYQGGLYSDWSNNISNDSFSIQAGPTNMYGTSYIRAVTLNNGGKYIKNGMEQVNATQNSSSAFAKFTMSSVSGNVTQYLVKPSAVSWQTTQDSTKKLGYYTDYTLPNEACGDSSNYYNWYSTTKNGSASSMWGYAYRSDYLSWRNDYIWLPSVTEVGSNATNDGIWQLVESQRQNHTGQALNVGFVGKSNPTTGSGASTYTLTRSGGSQKGSEVVCLHVTVNSSFMGTVSMSQAVRPALHLNLSLAVQNLDTAAVTLNNQSAITAGSTSVKVIYGQQMTGITPPKKNGYVFQGYYTSTSGNGTKYYNADGTSAKNCDFVGAKTLYAYWKGITYSVRFHSNYGTDATSSQGPFTYGTAQALADNAFSRTGYTFQGWAISATSTTADYADKASVSGLTTKNNDVVDLYAVWKEYVYNITMKFDGGSYNNSLSRETTFTYSTTQTFPVPVKAGYNLTGWKCSYNNIVSTCSNSTLSYKVPYLGANGDDVTFTAQWTGVPYTIYFNANGGSGSMSSQSNLVYGKSNNLKINSFTRTGYTFSGWALSPNGTAVFENGESLKDDESDSSKISERKVLNIISSSPYISYKSSFTLYAYWEPKTFTIKYNGNDSTSGSMSNQTLTYGTSLTISANSYVKTGYIFKYWTTSVNSGSIYYSNQSISTVPDDIAKKTADSDRVLNLYAYWEETWTAHASSSLATASSVNPGSENNPYLISGAGDLSYIAKAVNNGTTFAGVHFKQTAQINLNSYTWQPIGSSSTKVFKGIYDGQGYLIKNLKTSQARETSSTGNYIYSYQGLFGYTNGATLRNINIINGNVCGYNFVGSLVGYANTGVIKNCRSGAEVNGYNYCGLVGDDIGLTITSCYNYGNVSGYNYIGGIVGRNYTTATTISNCYFKGNVTAKSTTTTTYCGGILGYSLVSSSVISACGVSGNVSNKNYSGAIAGRLTSGQITNCFADTNLSIICKTGVTVASSLYTYTSGSTTYKKYVGSTSSVWTDWSVTASGRPLPAGFSWLGRGGTPLTLKILKDELHYTA